jgi:catechol 2,3-dioxygenase-like lactoylglutathione lyase family enzyme
MSASPGSAGFAPGHLGVCVTDLERSLAFYCDGLGCVPDGRYELDRPIAEIGDAPAGVALTLQFVRSGTLRIELLAFDRPVPHGEPSTRRDRVGLTHLSFVVDDVDVAARHLAAHGGSVVEGTRSGANDPGGPQVVFVADPDGTRIELVAAPRPASG